MDHDQAGTGMTRARAILALVSAIGMTGSTPLDAVDPFRPLLGPPQRESTGTDLHAKRAAAEAKRARRAAKRGARGL